LDRRHTGRLRKRDNLLAGGGGGEGDGEKPNNTTARKPGHILHIQSSLDIPIKKECFKGNRIK
jgi:hypothetical protein